MTTPPDLQTASTPPATAGAAQTREGSEDAPPVTPGQGRERIDFQVSVRVGRAAHTSAYEPKPEDPVYRPLRIYALDPTAALSEGAEATVNVPYEPLEAGPRAPMFEIIDDELVKAGTPALDLDQRDALIGQGFKPSITDPRFRAQMAYAVCSTTYAAFRHALGRQPTWCFRRGCRAARPSPLIVRTSVAELGANACYDAVRGELRFGVYQARDEVRGRNIPGGRVYTVLQHDVVVHETAHALLDCLRAQFMVPTNPDVLAFHEAFADLVAVLQRFTYRDVVRAQLQKARGDLQQARELGAIGRQIGDTTGLSTVLRNALAEPCESDASDLEPHNRAKVLTGAVFDAYVQIYRAKSARLMKLATSGSGVLPPGDLPELLLQELTDLACKLAGQFLTMCIRAIDYCPPVDMTFGEYLRAVITADFDLVRDDRWAYRQAWIDAFLRRKIYPKNVLGLTEDALLWNKPDHDVPALSELGFARLQFRGDPGHPASALELNRQARQLGAVVSDPRYSNVFGLVSPGHPLLNGDVAELPMVESVRSARRVGPNGQVVFDLIAEVTQRRHVAPSDGESEMPFYGGCTVILDPMGSVRYVIRKSVVHAERLARAKEYVQTSLRFWALGPERRLLPSPAPFLLVHEAKQAALNVHAQAAPAGGHPPL